MTFFVEKGHCSTKCHFFEVEIVYLVGYQFYIRGIIEIVTSQLSWVDSSL